MVIFKPHTEVKYELDCAWEVFINEYVDINSLDLGKKIQFERIPYTRKRADRTMDFCFDQIFIKVWGHCLVG